MGNQGVDHPSNLSARREARRAVGELAAAHGATLYSLGMRLCGSPEAAEEMVQETFLNAYRGWGTFQGDARATTWLYTIAKRVCMRQRRPRVGEPKRLESLEDLLPGQQAEVADLGAWSGAPEDPRRRQFAREAEETVDRALSELPFDFRLALVLVDIAELSIGEAAKVLGVKPATVKTRVHRARLKLRRAVEAGLPRRAVPRTQPAQVCYSMLQAKQEALDRGVDFPYADAALCDRCRAVFATLDLGREACQTLRSGEMPAGVVERLGSLLERPRGR